MEYGIALYHNKNPIYSIFYLLKRDYRVWGRLIMLSLSQRSAQTCCCCCLACLKEKIIGHFFCVVSGMRGCTCPENCFSCCSTAVLVAECAVSPNICQTPGLCTRSLPVFTRWVALFPLHAFTCFPCFTSVLCLLDRSAVPPPAATTITEKHEATKMANGEALRNKHEELANAKT